MTSVAVERVNLNSDTDLQSLVERVHEDGRPCIIERDGEPVAVVISPDAFEGSPDAASLTQREKRLAFAGIWSDLDADGLIVDVYRRRHASPANPPSAL
jgi:PHD/YefM family antitoxin component YafN of YafNO toxin-antitoxin module